MTTGMAGLPATRRRRTPGLRREEVAELANISTALYAWLEQGRDVPISRRTIDAIADALQFTPSERDHVRTLVTHESTVLSEEVSPALERLVASLPTHPVFVVNHKWDVVLYNRAAQLVFNNGDEMEPPFNLLQATFEQERRRLFVDWRAVAAGLVEMFRYDYALYASEPGPLALVESLRSSDPIFEAIWAEHHVRRAPSALKQINHPIAGLLTVDPSIFAVVESPGLRMLLYTPGNDEAAHKIAALATPPSPATST